MGDRLKSTLLALVFAIPFGGAGAFSVWAIASMARESARSADWVVVKATVQSADLHIHRGKSKTYEATGTYRYQFGGKDRTISVYVNPDDPSQAVVDRDLRWGFVAFLSLFAILFGGVGLGALAAIVAIWAGKLAARDAKKVRRPAKPAKPIDAELEKLFGAGAGKRK